MATTRRGASSYLPWRPSKSQRSPASSAAKSSRYTTATRCSTARFSSVLWRTAKLLSLCLRTGALSTCLPSASPVCRDAVCAACPATRAGAVAASSSVPCTRMTCSPPRRAASIECGAPAAGPLCFPRTTRPLPSPTTPALAPAPPVG